MIRALLLTSALSVAAMSPAAAGGLGEPVMEPTVVEAQASSSGGVLVPLLILLLVAVAIASSSGGGDAPVVIPDPL